MWFKRLDASELTPDLVAAMKRDGLAVQDTDPSTHMITVTTENAWMANKWEMSEQKDRQLPQETFLDQLAKIGALNFIFLFVLGVLGVAWFLWRNRR